ncbi:MAG: [FeFe] hydrogenase H-cluster radical SAM maturase HydE [Elusimicrobiales bacterium]|nr:[FeFe] hydrogenase H-cluster radical SAM maturase HydE [Elusimicrobiales bacterium]
MNNVEILSNTRTLPDSTLLELISTDKYDAELFAAADKVRRSHYGNEVFLRGLIEFTNFCRNDCLYCGIRRSNRNAERYRLTTEQIMQCCAQGYALGYRTFVLQGGEDPYFVPDKITEIIRLIKDKYSDCAITLSLGEWPEEYYKAWHDAGADRYLLRHETATPEHYSKLHPAELSLENRINCLMTLKKLGYQVGAGFMVGSPYQTTENIIADLRFLQDFQPDMIGIGPFIHHKDTPFADFPDGSVSLTLRLISIIRLMLPYVLLPATTALGTLDPQGREKGLKAGANVVMPNLSPVTVRKKYALYENKICTGEEAAECKGCLQRRVESAGYKISDARGDVKTH